MAAAVVRRMFAHQRACPPGSLLVRLDPAGTQVACRPLGPRMVGALVSPVSPGGNAPPPGSETQGEGPSCSLRSYLAEDNTGAGLGALATALGVGGAVAGLLLAGRPFSGGMVGVSTGGLIAAYKFATWKEAGGTGEAPGACG